ncbi:MAG: hypothetical protein WBO45_05265 [Planctomycetota bacterium]
MNYRRSPVFAFTMLFAAACVLLFGQDWLARALVPAMHGFGEGAPRLASLWASLAMHLLAGVWILPWALRLAGSVGHDAVRACVYTALFAVFGRAAVEVGIGKLLAGMPLLTMAGAAVAIAAVRPWLLARLGASRARRRSRVRELPTPVDLRRAS